MAACTFTFEQDTPEGLNYTAARSKNFDLPKLRECEPPAESNACDGLWNNNLCPVDQKYVQPIVTDGAPLYRDDYVYFQFNFLDSYNHWYQNNVNGGWSFGSADRNDPAWTIAVELLDGCCQSPCADSSIVCSTDLSVTFEINRLPVSTKLMIGRWDYVNQFVDVGDGYNWLAFCYQVVEADPLLYANFLHPAYAGGSVIFYLQELVNYYNSILPAGVIASSVGNRITITYTQAYVDANPEACRDHCCSGYALPDNGTGASIVLIHDMECCPPECGGNEAQVQGWSTISIKFQEVYQVDGITLMPQTWYFDSDCLTFSEPPVYVVDTNLSFFDNSVLCRDFLMVAISGYPINMNVEPDGTINVERQDEHTCCDDVLKYWVETTEPCPRIQVSWVGTNGAGVGNVDLSEFNLAVCGVNIDMSAYLVPDTGVQLYQFVFNAIKVEIESAIPSSIVTVTHISGSNWQIDIDMPYESTHCYQHCDDGDDLAFNFVGTFDGIGPPQSVIGSETYDIPCCTMTPLIATSQSPIECCTGNVNCWTPYVPSGAEGWIAMIGEDFYQTCRIPTANLPDTFQFKFTFRNSMNSYIEVYTEPYCKNVCRPTVKTRGLMGIGTIDCNGKIYGFPSQLVASVGGHSQYFGDNFSYINEYRVYGECIRKGIKIEKESTRRHHISADISEVYLYRGNSMPPYAVDRLIPTFSGMFNFVHFDDTQEPRVQIMWGNSFEKLIDAGKMWRLEFEGETVKCNIDHKCPQMMGVF